MTEGVSKRTVAGALVKRLTHTRTDRGMTLIPEATRCLMAREIHELVTTDQRGLQAGSRVDRVGFLGFVEIERGGVVERGDRLLIDGRWAGIVVGFDACHYPNHYNVLVEAGQLETAASLQLSVEATVRFLPADAVEADGRSVAGIAPATSAR
jgi:hypothetical protein